VKRMPGWVHSLSDAYVLQLAPSQEPTASTALEGNDNSNCRTAVSTKSVPVQNNRSSSRSLYHFRTAIALIPGLRSATATATNRMYGAED